MTNFGLKIDMLWDKVKGAIWEYRYIILASVIGAIVTAGVLAALGNPVTARGTTHFGPASFTGQVAVTGASDTTQLAVTSYTTQTSNLVEYRQSGGAPVAVVDGNGNITTTGDVTATGNIVAADVSGSGDLVVGTWFNLSPAATVVITVGDVITPLGSYQPITSTVIVTCSTATCIVSGTNTGDLLLIHNGNASDDLILDGTGANVECGADTTVPAGEGQLLYWNGEDWACLGPER